MAELTTEQIIKIVIAVLVLVVVLGGVYLIFRDKIFSYFGDLAPAEEQDLSSPYYQELLKEQNLVARIASDAKERYIFVGEKKTSYYIKKGTVYLHIKGLFDTHYFDKNVGTIGKDNKIHIDKDELNDPTLQLINGAEKIGNELRRLRN